MTISNEKEISYVVSSFHGRFLPEPRAELAGYAALMTHYDLACPLPEKLAAISSQHRQYENEEWRIYTLRHKPSGTLRSQLTFALKYEGIDLYILKKLFEKIDPNQIEMWVRDEPLSQYSRRIWFLYEWLLGKHLSLPDLKSGNFVDVLNEKMYYVGPRDASKRHRVRNNLPGVREFCPLIRRTEKLEKFISLGVSKLAFLKAGAIHPDVLARAAAFLLLKDSRASFEIEGERPGKNRTERWGRAIGQAGLFPLSISELVRLQSIVIEDQRFVHIGLRKEGGFIGMHERATRHPLPDHISARPQDLTSLMDGFIAAHNRLQTSNLDPVLCAALLAFGFVFIHPFEDGNGRIHRYLIHHVLAEKGYTPKGLFFPVSSVILERLDNYRSVLEAYSRPRIELIHWKATPQGNIEVLNDTADLYRYFDGTKQAEFLYECVSQTAEKNLPEEISYLENYDQIKAYIAAHFDMPNHIADLLIQFLHQNKGKLSKRARENEFKNLSSQEVSALESRYKEIFKESRP